MPATPPAAPDPGRRVGRVLVVEDDPAAAEAIADVVRLVGYAVRVADTAGRARRIAAEAVPDLALVDQDLPDGDGVDLVRELAALGVPDIVVIGAFGSRDVVVDALRAGVSDFLRKPVRLSRVRRTVLGSPALRGRAADAEARPAPPVEVEPAALAGRSRASRALRERVERLAALATLRALIVGPAGTDKRRVAARLHRESGAPGPALFVDCAHERDGAATDRFLGRARDDARGARAVRGYLDRARGGTLVLDDLSLLPRDLQSVLCTALAAPGPGSDPDGSGPRDGSDGSDGSDDRGPRRSIALDCGVVGILREPARLALSTGRLSADLHLALSGAILEVPSLDERREDIAEIVEVFLAELGVPEDGAGESSDEFAVWAAERPWPGNLLQLRNALRTAWDRASPEPDAGALVGRSFEDVRRDLLLATLEHVGGDKRLCASLLGIGLKTVYARLERSQRSRRHAARAERAAAPARPAGTARPVGPVGSPSGPGRRGP